MTENEQDAKKQQFNEFFNIEHDINVNIVPLAPEFELPEIEDIEQHMPYAFRMASEISTIESKAIRPLRNISDHASELAAYLTQLSKKIDLMMSYVLHQQDDHDKRFIARRFGGGGIIVRSTEAFELGKHFQLKLFLEEEATAVFCYGEVIACDPSEDGFDITLIFSRIREQDQELLVKASLHLQTKQLKKRSQSRSSQ
ncbi:MAG: PilZ domain-containing protein [Aestuariibacter sp.]